MKKILPAFLSAVLLLTACSNTADNKQPETNQSSENDPFLSADNITSTAEQTSEYDPFANTDDNNGSQTAGSFSFRVNWEEGKELILDYSPTVSFDYFIDNSGKTTDFGLLIFVNGFSQPYRTEDESQNKVMHTFYVNQNEPKTQTIEFEPIVGEKGEEVSVEIVTMFQPGFIQEESNNYEFNHRISSIWPSKMAVTQETGLSEPKVCSEYEVTKISDEMRQEFNTINSTGAVGENDLDSKVHIETLKNDVFLTPKDISEGKFDSKPFTNDDSVTLCMYGGKSCKYRVSMYINHDLVKGAFDGADYIDITCSNDAICKKQIDMNGIGVTLNDYNHLYFIAVPFYENQNYGEKMVIKPASVTVKNS